MNETLQSVLILDDEDAVRESFMAYFEDHGWSVLGAATAEDALALLKHNSPNGAIVDIRLPGIDGNEFIRQATKTHPHLTCIICTGSPEYHPPADITSLPNTYGIIFAKPVIDMPSMEQELLKQITQNRARGSHT